jgi:hypothetical protein
MLQANRRAKEVIADRVPRRGVAFDIHGVFRVWPEGVSACHCRQADERIIAHLSDGFQRHVPSPLNGPLIVLFQQQRADEPDDRFIVGKYANDSELATEK